MKSRLIFSLSLLAALTACNSGKKKNNVAPPPAANGNGNGNGNGAGNGNGNGNGSQTPGVYVAPFDMPVWPKSDKIDDDFIPFYNEGDEIIRDINQIRADEPDDVEFVRYLTLTHMNYLNFASDADFANWKSTIIDSMSVVLNSLSIREVVTKPQSINGDMTIFRIDIRDYGWNAQQWERLISDNAADKLKDPYPYLNDFDANVVEIARLTRTAVPIVRADWFVSEATKASSYHDLVGVPPTLRDLEKNVVVLDRIANIQRLIDQPEAAPTVWRLGLGPGDSGVSIQNRILERHTAKDGAFWISYDFGPVNNNDVKSIFTSPVGPGPDIKDFVGDNGLVVKAFQPDGGELIWNLPNGLQAYMLINARGQRLDEAPSNIVFDPKARDDQGIIRNGISCMECHANGIIAAKDRLRDRVEKSSDEVFFDDVKEFVEAIHPKESVMTKLMDQDNNMYTTAAQQAQFFNSLQNHITQAYDYYDKDMTKDMVASELNITTKQLDRYLPFVSEQLQAELEPMNQGRLERETFEILFAQLIKEFFDLQQTNVFKP